LREVDIRFHDVTGVAFMAIRFQKWYYGGTKLLIKSVLRNNDRRVTKKTEHDKTDQLRACYLRSLTSQTTDYIFCCQIGSRKNKFNFIARYNTLMYHAD
jgi:hypothetical protein